MLPVDIDELYRRVRKLEEDNQHLKEIVQHLTTTDRHMLDCIKNIREAFQILAKGVTST